MSSGENTRCSTRLQHSFVGTGLGFSTGALSGGGLAPRELRWLLEGPYRLNLSALGEKRCAMAAPKGRS
jgi:hypothetical protein